MTVIANQAEEVVAVNMTMVMQSTETMPEPHPDAARGAAKVTISDKTCGYGDCDSAAGCRNDAEYRNCDEWQCVQVIKESKEIGHRRIGYIDAKACQACQPNLGENAAWFASPR